MCRLKYSPNEKLLHCIFLTFLSIREINVIHVRKAPMSSGMLLIRLFKSVPSKGAIGFFPQDLAYSLYKIECIYEHFPFILRLYVANLINPEHHFNQAKNTGTSE